MAMYFIKPDGNDSSSGTSWSTAWKTLEHFMVDDHLSNNDKLIVRAGQIYSPSMTVAFWKYGLTFISEKRAYEAGIIGPTKDPGYVDSYVTIDGSSITSGTFNKDIMCIDVYGLHGSGPNDCRNFTADGFILQNGIRNGFWVPIPLTTFDENFNSGHTLNYVTIKNTAEHGLYIRKTKNFTIKNSEFAYNALTEPFNSYLHSVYFNDSDDIIIEDSIIHDCGTQVGVHMNGGCYDDVQCFVNNCIVRRCKFYNIPGVSIGYYNAIGGRIENNLIYDPIMCQVGEAIYANYGIRVSIDENDQDGIVEGCIPSNGVTIVNNTIVTNDPDIQPIWLVHERSEDNPVGSINCVVFNNLLINADGIPNNSLIHSDLDNHTTPNNYFARYTVANMSSLFVDYTNKDFHLKSKSPAIDYGCASATNSQSGTKYAPTSDMDGVTRPYPTNGSFDCGSFECASGYMPYGVSIVTPPEVTDSEALYISQFTKNYEVRVKMFRNIAGTIYDSNPISNGDYNILTGVYEVLYKIWIKKAVIPSVGGYIAKLEYYDDYGNWITCCTSSDGIMELKYPIYANKLRFSRYNEKDTNDFSYPSTNPAIYSDTWFDVTNYVSESISIENNTGDISGEVKLPFVSIQLNNRDGIWSKGTEFLLKYYESIRTNLEKISSSSYSVPKTAGTRISVEIRFFGPNWEPSDWIIVATFYARRFTSSGVSGESGWVAKTKFNSPIVEGATLFDIIDRYIVKDNGTMLLQVHNNFEDEIVTINNEYVGDISLEPTSPRLVIGDKYIMSYCQDDTYIYFAEKHFEGYMSWDGLIHIYRAIRSGEDVTLIGKIYPTPNSTMLIDGEVHDLKARTEYNEYGSFFIGSNVNINNGQAFSRMTRAVYGMAVDDTYLYLSCLSSMNCTYGTLPEHNICCFESYILKLPKDGSGWESIVGKLVNQSGPSTPGTAYTTSNRFSLGFNFQTSIPYDPYDFTQSGVYLPVIRGLTLYNDSGINKLLFVKERQRTGADSGYATSEYWIVKVDFTNATQYGSEPYTSRVECIFQYSNRLLLAHWSTWSGGSVTGKYIGPMKRDLGTGYFYIDYAQKASVLEWFYSMGLLEDGIYTAGNKFDVVADVYGYFPNNELITMEGLKEKYSNVFNLDGFNIIDFRHETRNKYLVYPTPEIFIGGATQTMHICRYGSEIIDGDMLYTDSYSIDLRSGLLILNYIFPSGNEIRIGYDMLRSVMFYNAESDSRLGRDGGLSDLVEAFSVNTVIDETGSLRRLKFIESQSIPISYTDVEYYKIEEDTGHFIIPAEGQYGYQINYPASYTDDKLFSFQFTPEVDCVLERIAIPVKIQKTAVGTINPVNDVPKDIDIYLTNSGINYNSSNGGVSPIIAPTSSLLQSLNSTKIYIASNKIDSSGSSEYYWITFDISYGSKQLTANTNYGIVLRIGPSMDIFNYRMMGKKTGNLTTKNRCIQAWIADGDPIENLPSSRWSVPGLIAGSCMCKVYTRRKKQELKSIFILDSSNTTLPEFNSVLGGDGSTVAVYDEMFNTKYIEGTDYTITYSGGKFYINFYSSLADSSKSVVVLWFDSQTDVISISDYSGDNLLQNSISEQHEFGDETTYLRASVSGRKLLPSPTNVKIVKAYEITPGIGLELEQSIEQAKKFTATNVYQWNNYKRMYEEVEQTSEEFNQFVLEFEDPFIIGTTEFSVKYGMGHKNGAYADDPVQSGTITPSNADAPKFYEVEISPSIDMIDNTYHVMFRKDEYRSWRICTSDDYEDIITPGYLIGDSPIDEDDIFTKNHFYIKRMNRGFGQDVAHYIAYRSKIRKFYIDKNGEVVENSLFDSTGDQNPIPTSYLDKKIYVLIEPMDFKGNPLFESHSESGLPGYDSDMLSSVKSHMAVNIDRVNIKSKGLDLIYSNWGTENKSINITVIGYPLNFVTNVNSERRMEGYVHADAKSIEINNDLIQTEAIANKMTGILMLLYGNERINFRKEIVFDPRIRPGSLVRVTSENNGLVNALFYVTNTNYSFSRSGFITVLEKLLQI